MTIRTVLSVLAMMMLVALGAAFEGDHHDFGGDHRSHHDYHDWLSPGFTYTYSWSTPTYWYTTYTYPVYYPVYRYYYTPVVYYYDPVIWDPWYATNVYGLGGVTYHYSSSWSWHHGGGFFFDP